MHPVILTGCERSGTTLLRNILDRHPRLCVTHETLFFTLQAGRLGDKGHPAELWDRFARETLHGGDFSALREAALGRLPDPCDMPALFLALVQADAEATGKGVWGEKSPTHLNFLPYLLKAYPDAKAIITLRDGRDVAASLSKVPWSGAGSNAVLALRWVLAVDLSLAFARRWPERILLLRYEDLLYSPEPTVAKAMAFLGGELDPAQLKAQGRGFADDKKPWHDLAGKNFDTSRAYAWKRGMDPAEAAWLSALQAPELAKLGYEAGAPLPWPLKVKAAALRLLRWDRFLPFQRWRLEVWRAQIRGLLKRA